MFGIPELFDFNSFRLFNFDTPSMYEIGKYFLQHKFVVKRHKNKRGRRK